MNKKQVCSQQCSLLESGILGGPQHKTKNTVQHPRLWSGKLKNPVKKVQQDLEEKTWNKKWQQVLKVSLPTLNSEPPLIITFLRARLSLALFNQGRGDSALKRAGSFLLASAVALLYFPKQSFLFFVVVFSVRQMVHCTGKSVDVILGTNAQRCYYSSRQMDVAVQDSVGQKKNGVVMIRVGLTFVEKRAPLRERISCARPDPPLRPTAQAHTCERPSQRPEPGDSLPCLQGHTHPKRVTRISLSGRPAAAPRMCLARVCLSRICTETGRRHRVIAQICQVPSLLALFLALLALFPGG